MPLKKIVAIVGARPQFIKHYPVERTLGESFKMTTIHTGQHYDDNMSRVFFSQLGMSKPDYMLSIGSGKHGQQTGRMMIDLEPIIESERADYVLLYGDTNSTLAGALVSAKLQIPIIHIEAGLRSFNMSMPEEVNRILTDRISRFLFTPSKVAVENLLKEGIEDDRIFDIGDVMKDLLNIAINDSLLPECPVEDEFYYATIHRPYNTDEKERLAEILTSLNDLGAQVVFSLHPRTRKMMSEFDLELSEYKHISFIDPQAYFENLSYINSSLALITDSGGMQKEAYWLKKKCVTIRSETEWTETLEGAWNDLVFSDIERLAASVNRSTENWDDSLYGDGKAAQKIRDILLSQN